MLFRSAGISAYLRKPSGLHVLASTLAGLPAAAAGGAKAPVAAEAVDRDRLRGHLEVLGDGGLRAIVAAFDRAAETTLAALRAPDGVADATVVDALHGLRGAAGQLGLDGVARRAGALEAVARTGDGDRLADECDAFARDLRRARNALAAAVDDLARRRAAAPEACAGPGQMRSS